MIINNKTIEVSFEVGTTILNAVKECISFCEKYKTEVKLTFNGDSHTVTRFTNLNSMVKNWYK